MTISIPNHINTLDVLELTRDEVIEKLVEYWQAGIDLTECTADLPLTIINLGQFENQLRVIIDRESIHPNQVTAELVIEALEVIVHDEWDVLHDMINEYSEGYAEACLEYANGGDLESAQSNYIGCFDSDEDFIIEMNEDLLSDMPEHLQRYFDWESYTADCMHDYVEYNGHYFNA